MSAKYPRTFHLPNSPGATRDDRVASDVSALVGREVVVTEKLDGSNVALTSSGPFARSHNGAPAHPSFHPLRAVWAERAALLHPEVTVFAEWCYAVHSIRYPDLRPERWCQVIAARHDRTGVWLSWDEVSAEASRLSLPTVPVLWRGVFASAAELTATTETLARQGSVFGPDREGVVVRAASSFFDDCFPTHVAKWVRANHVRTDRHWRSGPVIRHDEARS